MAEVPETRGSTTHIPIPEYAGKWAIGFRGAARNNTRKIGIEKREDRSSEVLRAVKEFNRLVHDKFEELCIQKGLDVYHGYAGIARKLIAYKVNGYKSALETELKFVSDKYKPIIMSLLDDPQILEAYRRIKEAKKR